MAVVLNQVRVGVLDNDPLALRMFRTLFASRPDITLIWLERHPSVAVQSCVSAVTRPDVLVVDMALEGISGITVCEKVRGMVRSIRLLGVTAYRTSAYHDAALACGMEAVVSKLEPRTLLAHILDPVHDGIPQPGEQLDGLDDDGQSFANASRQLSTRELEALQCFCDGLTSGQAMDRLHIGRSTLASYERRALLKLDASSRAEAVAICVRTHILS
ncbi:MAG: Two-component response regulator [Bifidobacterium crudilactis]|jgi:two-component system, NarL family, response regulator DevR|uniref:response regulator n=1 Tax=Bifidobacterium crudilactis TaxID=327277 RepID=UPI003A5BC095